MARVAAAMALRVLNGERPQDIPIVRNNNIYLFDWRALNRWGIKEKDLPSGSTLLFPMPSAWERAQVGLAHGPADHSRSLYLCCLSAFQPKANQARKRRAATPQWTIDQCSGERTKLDCLGTS